MFSGISHISDGIILMAFLKNVGITQIYEGNDIQHHDAKEVHDMQSFDNIRERVLCSSLSSKSVFEAL